MTTFTVGGIDFTAVKANHPRKPGAIMWLLKIDETGEVWEPGQGGVSNESRPKMREDLEYMFERTAKRNPAEWRRQLGMEATQ